MLPLFAYQEHKPHSISNEILNTNWNGLIGQSFDVKSKYVMQKVNM